MGPSGNGPQSLPERKGGTLSPVRCLSKIREIAAISSDLAGIGARFLCVPDCVAEREGFDASTAIDNTQLTDFTIHRCTRNAGCSFLGTKPAHFVRPLSRDKAGIPAEGMTPELHYLSQKRKLS
jgi:hypothetical protein